MNEDTKSLAVEASREILRAHTSMDGIKIPRYSDGQKEYSIAGRVEILVSHNRALMLELDRHKRMLAQSKVEGPKTELKEARALLSKCFEYLLCFTETAQLRQDVINFLGTNRVKGG